MLTPPDIQTFTPTQLCPILHTCAFIMRTPSSKESPLTGVTLDCVKKYIARAGKEKEKHEFTALLDDAVLHTAFTCVRGRDDRIRKV